MRLRALTGHSLTASARAALPYVSVAWLAAVLLGVRAQDPGTGLPGASLVLLGAGLALLLTSGAAAADLRTGTVDLWVQTGVTRRAVTSARLAESLLLTALALPPAALPYLVGSPDPWAILGFTLPLALLTAWMVAAVVFGFSGWGVRPDVLWAAATVLYLGALGQDALVAPEQFRSWGPVLRLLRFPFEEAHALARWSVGEAVPWRALVRPVAYMAAWTLVGLAGAEVRMRAYRAPTS